MIKLIKLIFKKRKNKDKNILRPIFLLVRISIKKLMKLRSTPHQIALGFGVGTFVGIFPTFGLGIILITFLGLVWKYNIPSAIFATAIANPFLGPFWIFLSYKIGGFISGFFMLKEALSIFEKDVLNKFLHIGIDYIIGNIIISTLAGVILYFTALLIVNAYKKKSKLMKKYSTTNPG